jgi:hypothetical protein
MIGPALAVAGAPQRIGVQLHQALCGEADHLAQQCRVGTLLQQLAKGDLVVGHRGDLQGSSCGRQPNPNQEHRGDHRCG